MAKSHMLGPPPLFCTCQIHFFGFGAIWLAEIAAGPGGMPQWRHDDFANMKRTSEKIRASPVEGTMGEDRGWNTSGGSGGSFGHVFGPHGCPWVAGRPKRHPAGHFGVFWATYVGGPVGGFRRGPLPGARRGRCHPPAPPPPYFWVAGTDQIGPTGPADLVSSPLGAAVPQRGFWGKDVGRFLYGGIFVKIQPSAWPRVEMAAG